MGQGETHVVVEESVLDKSVLAVYLVIVTVLGAALIYSLSLSKDYQTFSSAIVTSLTTIADFAIGVNSGQRT